jgi:hypothetical protein
MIGSIKIATKIIFTLLPLFLIFFTAGCGKEVSRTPVEPEAPQGFIYVSSIPDGFTIYRNSRNTGRLTPDSISYIESGVYEITLRKKYYKDTSVVVTLGENEKLHLNIDILSNPSMRGKLFLQSTPTGAAVTINDSVLNLNTPVTIQDLLPGEYRVKLSLFNYRAAEFKAIVESGKTNSYPVSLRDTSVWVDYQVFNSGIPSNQLTAITIDEMNIKWIGSLDKGLIKYDEVNFVYYNTSNSSMPSNIVNCIAVDNLNKVWVGTNEGIGVFDGNVWTIYNHNNSGLTSDFINIIRFDFAGNAWIGASANIAMFDGINWTLYNEPLGRDWIMDFYIEDPNKIWLGSKSNGIFILQNSIYNELPKIQYNYPSYSVSSMSLDQSGNLWFCFLPDSSGRGGVSYWNGGSFTNFFVGTFQNNINHVFVDEQNNKWFSSTEGFVRFDALNNATVFNTSNSLLSANNVRASVRDQNGNVWITTIGGGLNKLKWSTP